MSFSNSFEYSGINGSSGANSFQYTGINGSSGANSFQYTGISGSSGPKSCDNIDKVLDGFKNGNLEYKRYLELMCIEDELAPYLAWTKFKETPNLTASYMLNFNKALKGVPRVKESFIRETLAGTTADQAAAHYCSILENQGKKTCECYNTAKVLADTDKKARDDYNNKIVPAWKEENRISKLEYEQKVEDTKRRRDEYINGKYDPRFTHGSTPYTNGIAKPQHQCVGKHSEISSPDEKKYYVEYKGENTNVCPDSYDRVWYIWHNLDYQDLLLKNWDAKNKITEWKESSQPVFVPTDMVSQCCSNSVNVGQGGSSAQNIVQSCNQTAIMGIQAEQDAEKKASDEAVRKKAADEAAAKKKKEEEEAAIKEEEEAAIQKEKDEIAAAKKKKMIMTIVGIVVFLALGFAAYMFFTSKSRDAIGGTSSPSETPSVQTGTPLSNTSE